MPHSVISPKFIRRFRQPNVPIPSRATKNAQFAVRSLWPFCSGVYWCLAHSANKSPAGNYILFCRRVRRIGVRFRLSSPPRFIPDKLALYLLSCSARATIGIVRNLCGLCDYSNIVTEADSQSIHHFTLDVVFFDPGADGVVVYAGCAKLIDSRLVRRIS